MWKKSDFTPYRKRKSRRFFDPLNTLLKEWYGEDVASFEIIPHLPKEITIESAMENIITDYMSPEDLTLLELKKNWNSLMGSQIAKIAKPRNIKNGLIYIEVSHSVWLMELQNYSKKMILEKIKKCCGKNFCKDIKFVPSE